MEWVIVYKDELDIRVALIAWSIEDLGFDSDIEIAAFQGMSKALVESGIVLVGPTGNEFGSIEDYYGSVGVLGSIDEVVTVGALNKDMSLATYSAKGPTDHGTIKPNVAAIGSNIMAPNKGTGTGYTSKSGTSMSAAVVAGISALIIEANPDVTPDEIRIILETTSEYRWSNHPVRPNNDYGWGIVNASNAVNSVGLLSEFKHIVPSHSTRGPIDTVNYTKSETEGWNLTSSRYQVVAGTGIYFDLLNTDELVVCDLEIDFSEIVEGGDYCEENPYFFFEPGNFSFIVRMLVNDANESYNGPTLPFYLHINVVATYSDFTVYSNLSHNICNTTEITFTGVNNGNYQDTMQVRIANLQELEDAGFMLALPAKQYLIGSGSEQLIRVIIDSTGVEDTETDYPLTLNVSTTLQGDDTSAENTTIMKFIECQGGNEEDVNETVFPGKPTAIAGQDVNISPGGTVQFSGAGTDEDGIITKYEWDFDGDGVYEWSSNENGLTTFIFNNAGTYTATLRVTDDSGKTATDSLTVTVKSPEVEEESRLPSLSLAASLAAVAVIALRRRPE